MIFLYDKTIFSREKIEKECLTNFIDPETGENALSRDIKYVEAVDNCRIFEDADDWTEWREIGEPGVLDLMPYISETIWNSLTEAEQDHYGHLTEGRLISAFIPMLHAYLSDLVEIANPIKVKKDSSQEITEALAKLEAAINRVSAREDFLTSPIGRKLGCMIRAWDDYLLTVDRLLSMVGRCPGVKNDLTRNYRMISMCSDQWDIYQLVLAEKFEKDYKFVRSETHFGIYAEDGDDWLYIYYRQGKEQ